ncbi:hypothetical protein BCV69DRAFT_281412 [Microstroma glucosiphilum]|uniref:Autophagy protein 5 n=1 Tax=Pseudomicrostroma glucosiphilum TaxID=1684307 RepID=A0A316UB78_9BASI|nr:hypothetical protein BCV69DRAFT_281412 [Pseudomicrostroma glucosiphilum]PWN22419.1 hypothetical protein BCV69DRAFT_281412 [Pseudomicrostroma glucosiphilum]
MSSTPARPSGSGFAGPSRLSSGPVLDPSSSASSSSSRIATDVFSSSLPLAVSVALSDLPSGSDSSLAAEYTYYMTVRRNLYLPLIVQEVKEALVGLICDARGAATIKDEELWFEYRGTPLKWHWPIGLLYDHSVDNLAPTRHHTEGTEAAHASSRRRREASPSRTSPYLQHPPPIPWPITLRLKDLPHAKLPSPTSNPTLASTENVIAALVESSKQAYMGMLKEADFVRNGNTKKVNNLRRPEQDGIWDALIGGDYAQFTSLTSRILPAASAYPAPPPQPSAPPSSYPSTFRSASHTSSHEDLSSSLVPRRASSLYAAPSGGVFASSQFNSSNPNLPIDKGSEDTAAAATESSATTSTVGPTDSGSRTVKGQGLPGLKAIPVKFVLQGGTILQEGVPPLTEDGKPTTLQHVLSVLFPALFPQQQISAASKGSPTISGLPTKSDNRLPTLGVDFSPLSLSPPQSTTSTPRSTEASRERQGDPAGVMGKTSTTGAGPGTGAGPLAVPIVQGIRIPLESPVAQLARSVSGADGW